MLVFLYERRSIPAAGSGFCPTIMKLKLAFGPHSPSMGCSEVSGSCFEHPCSQLPLKTATGKTPNRLPLVRLSHFVVSTMLMVVI